MPALVLPGVLLLTPVFLALALPGGFLPVRPDAPVLVPQVFPVPVPLAVPGRNEPDSHAAPLLGP